ncbi:MAG: hypothetical protein AAFN10_15790 [Bacteroidota bacterium]
MGARTKAIMLIFFTLMTGIGIGLWAGGRIFENRVEEIRETRSRKGFESFLNNELDLSIQQADEIKQVLQKHFPKMRQVHKDFFEERKRVAASLDSAIMPLLNPQQQEKWQEHQKRMHQKPRMQRRGGRPPQPPE